MRKLSYFVLVVVLLAAAVPSVSAVAPVVYYQITGGPAAANYCTNLGFAVPTFREFSQPGSLRGVMSVAGVGVVSDYSQSFGPQTPAAVGSWAVTPPNPYAVPAGTPITLQITAYREPGLVDPAYVTTLVFNCTDGAVISITNASLDVYEGAPIPDGFVLKTITCDVAVFDLPGGQPVGANMVTNGQTWFVNPTPEAAADGSSWTEIFVAGYTNGYIPTGCVQ